MAGGSSGGSSRKVIVVEDNPADVLLLGEAFASTRIAVQLECFDTGARALERLAIDDGERLSLILLDHRLPDTTGPELARIIASHPSIGRQPHVAILSGETSHGLAGPWEDWLVKPTSWQGWETLVRLLQQRFLHSDSRGRLECVTR